MLQPDARHDRNLAARDSRTVEPSAHARLEHGDIDTAFRIVQEGDKREHLEKGGFQRDTARGNALPRYRLRSGFHLQQQAVQDSGRNLHVVDADTFPQVHQMRTHVQARLEPVRLQYARKVKARRALTICSDHMNRLEFFLGIPESVTKSARRFQSRNHPEHQARFQIFQTS